MQNEANSIPFGNEDEIILAVDEQGIFRGEYISKKIGHTGKGRKHLAVTILIENNQNEVLLQKRKHAIFNDIWDMTASTHPRHRENGIDETSIEAALRALDTEYGIKKLESIDELGAIDYFAKYGELCENEHDLVLVGKYIGEIRLNENVAYGYEWIDKKTLLSDIEQHPDSYSPWAVEAAKILKEKGFFS